MPNVDKIIQLSNEGFSNKEIAERIGTEDEPLTYQAVAVIIKANKTETVKAEVVKTGIQTRTAEEYAEYSLSQGRTRYGGEKGVKVVATIEELRALVNSDWKPSMLLEKWQMDEDELVQLTWKLAKAELRDRQPTVNFKQDFFRF